MTAELILNRPKLRILQFLFDNDGMDVAMTQGDDEPILHSLLPGAKNANENKVLKEEVLDDMEEDRLVEPSVVERYGTEGYCVVRYTLTSRGEAALRRHNGKRSGGNRTEDQ